MDESVQRQIHKMLKSIHLNHLLSNAPNAAPSDSYPYHQAAHHCHKDCRETAPRSASGRTFNRSDIVKAIAIRQRGLPLDAVNHSVKVLLDGIAEALRQGRRVELRNFGIFQVTESGIRMRHNPATLAPFMELEKKRIRFKPGLELRSSVKNLCGVDVHPKLTHLAG